MYRGFESLSLTEGVDCTTDCKLFATTICICEDLNVAWLIL